jgi:hypothetical protein
MHLTPCLQSSKDTSVLLLVIFLPHFFFPSPLLEPGALDPPFFPMVEISRLDHGSLDPKIIY